MKNYDNFSPVFEIANQVLTHYSLYLAARMNAISILSPESNEPLLCHKYFHIASNIDEKSTGESLLSFTGDDVEMFIEAEKIRTLVERPKMM